jgi:hypothetical protein
MNAHRRNHTPEPAGHSFELAFDIALAVVVAALLVYSVLKPMGAFL